MNAVTPGKALQRIADVLPTPAADDSLPVNSPYSLQMRQGGLGS